MTRTLCGFGVLAVLCAGCGPGSGPVPVRGVVKLEGQPVANAAVVFVAMAWADYPLEVPLLGLTLANPVDLARVLLLLQLDSAALLGYTGAVFERFFGSALGAAVSTTALLAWCAAPLGLAGRRFHRKDF